jgi:hypothetical protein
MRVLAGLAGRRRADGTGPVRSTSRRSRTGESGAIALISAVVSIVLMVVCAFVVDIGGTWARRGQLQVQADQAALYAAEFLPAAGTAARREVAAQAAYYIACHTVLGQRELTPSIPGCSAGTRPSDPAIQTYGDALLAAGQVTFPSASRVKITTPPAKVEFSFGQAVGAKSSTQQKMAIAKVGSPGDVAPIGLSMNCMLSVADNLPALGDSLTGVLPLNYMSVGPIGPERIDTSWPTSPAKDSHVTVAFQSTSPTSTYQGMGATIALQGNGWGTLPDSQVQVWFALGKDANQILASAPPAVVAAGTTSAAVPSQVYNKAGVWKAKVAVRPAPTTTDPDPVWRMSNNDIDFTVNVPSATADLLGCGRALKSPRGCLSLITTVGCTNQGNFGNLTENLQDGIDHGMIAQSDLIPATTPATVDDMLAALNDPAVLYKCDNTGTNYKDIGGNIQTGKTPNCVHLEQGNFDGAEFTKGFLGAPESTATGTIAGRLVCTSERPCSTELRNPIDSSSLGLAGGYKINDDRFTDFVTGEGPLDAAMFFNLTTYLSPGQPVVTPTSRLDPAIYSSHRFFWVPVLSMPVQTNGNQAGDYPILTFRPVFVTQAQPSGIEAVDMVLALVDSWVRTLLGIDASDDHGILMNEADHTLRALRFMTIEPTALPATPEDYQGPTSEYVGAGPKIVQLVK